MTIIPFLFLLPLATMAATTTTTIPLGSTLTPASSTSSWSSPSSTFSISFLPVSSSFLLSLSYSGGYPLWSPLGPTATLGPTASFSLSSSGDLLLNSTASTTVWRSNTSSLGVTSAELTDTGNLRLLNSSGSPLWQSFEHPVDTLLQTQNFTPSQKLTSGAYSFSLLPTGNLTLTWNNTLEYSNKGNSSLTNLTSPVLTLQTDGRLVLNDPSFTVPNIVAYSSNYGETDEMMRFMRLDTDGNFRAYSVEKGSTKATDRWALVEDQCEVFGWCGDYGVCTYNDTSPICICPSQNFMMIDANDATKGCTRKQDLSSCSGNTTMLELDNTQFLTYPSQFSNEQFFVGLSACRTNCLSGSSCFGSTSLNDGSGYCFLKNSDFFSGYMSTSLPSTSFVKVCSPAEPNPPISSSLGSTTKKSKIKGWAIAVIILATILGLVLLELGIWWCFCRNSPKFGPSSAQYALLEYASGAPVQFSYKELHKSTKGFKEKLGVGGFGAVYRGTLANRTPVAVKQLEGIEQGEKQFRMEVATISSTHHLNLVRLIGFCSEGKHRLLVYEFMKNGSLDAFLFSDDSSSSKLNWSARFKIAVGTARGITYLHEECRDCIVHCDIKPENILLDENYNAKVSDFGLAKLVNPKEHRHRSMTSVRGTRGYLAPEWLANMSITAKSDVYSYGMVLLEIVSGRRNFDVSDTTGRRKFSLWAYEEYDKGNLVGILDTRIGAVSDTDMEQLERAMRVSFWCIQENVAMRPPMGKVVQILEGVIEVEKPPAPKLVSESGTSTKSISVSAVSEVVPSEVVLVVEG